MTAEPSRRAQRDAARKERVAAEQAAELRARQKRRFSQLGAVLLLAVIVLVIAVVVSSSGSPSTPKLKAGEVVAGQRDVAAMLDGIPQHGATLGSPKAKVTMVELVDAQCPFCRAYSQQVLPRVVQNYVRTGKVKVELHEWPILGPDSTTAGAFISGVERQNRGWNYASLFYFNQKEENSGYVTTAFLRKIARGVPGLDYPKAAAFAKTPAAQAPLQASDALASKLGTKGTPTLAVGSSAATAKKISGSDYGAVSSALGAALKKA